MAQDIPNDQTGTSYTLVLGDAGKSVWCDNASAVAVTIPTNASVAYPTNTVILIGQEGAGSVTISGDTGVTVNGVSAGSFEIGEQYASVAIVKKGTDEWIINAAQSNKYQYLGTSGAISSAASVEFTTASDRDWETSQR